MGWIIEGMLGKNYHSKSLKYSKLLFISFDERAHGPGVGVVVGESGRWGGSWTCLCGGICACASVPLTEVCKTWGWPNPRFIGFLTLSHISAALHSFFIKNLNTVSLLFAPLAHSIIYSCMSLAYGYLQWVVKWSLFKRIIFITHMGMLEIRNGLGTGGTLHSHGIVFCVLQ